MGRCGDRGRAAGVLAASASIRRGGDHRGRCDDPPARLVGLSASDPIEVSQLAADRAFNGENPYGVTYGDDNPYVYGPLGLIAYQAGIPGEVLATVATSAVLAWSGAWITLALFNWLAAVHLHAGHRQQRLLSWLSHASRIGSPAVPAARGRGSAGRGRGRQALRRGVGQVGIVRAAAAVSTRMPGVPIHSMSGIAYANSGERRKPYTAPCSNRSGEPAHAR